jgi:hypothetical protein
MYYGMLFRTKFYDVVCKRTRRKKPEQELKTKYYYRRGGLKITPVDNSSLGLYSGVYVFIKRYSKERDQFLIESTDGSLTWTDQVIPIKPVIGVHELYHTCFEFLALQDYHDGAEVCYRTQRGFAFLKKEINCSTEEYHIFIDGRLNLDTIPKSFNFCLGYSDCDALPVYSY